MHMVTGHTGPVLSVAFRTRWATGHRFVGWYGPDLGVGGQFLHTLTGHTGEVGGGGVRIRRAAGHRIGRRDRPDLGAGRATPAQP